MTVFFLFSGDPSAKDLEQLLSLGLVSSQSPSNHSTFTKHGSLKKRKRRKSSDRRRFTDSSLSFSRSSKTSDLRNEDRDAVESEIKVENVEKQHQNLEEINREAVKKTENRKEEQDVMTRRKREIEQQEKQKKSLCQLERNGFGQKHLSIHLVDIRHLDAEKYLIREQWERKDNSPLKTNAVPNGLSKKHTNGAQPANGRSWGKFRIPKRSEARYENDGLNKKPQVLLKPLTSLMKTDETDSKTNEDCLKRCHRNETTLRRRYDFIRRRVLAS